MAPRSRGAVRFRSSHDSMSSQSIPKHMPSIQMQVTLSQVDKNGLTTEAPYSQSIRSRADERGEGDILHAAAKKVQRFAMEMEERAQAFKDKHGTRPAWAFKATRPIRIRVTFDNECVMDTDKYCGHGGLQYNPTLKKMADAKGFDMLMDSFHLAEAWSAPVTFKRKK